MLKASQIAAALNGRVVGDGDTEILRAVHPAEASAPGDMAVAVAPNMLRLLGESTATIALVVEGSDAAADRCATVIVAPPSRTLLCDATRLFRHRPETEPGLHPTAVVAPDAEVAPTASIGPFTLIGSGVRIGAGTIVHSHATIEEGASIGEDCLIHSGVRIGWGCRIGDRAVIHHNASIGADGFGFIPMAPGAVDAARRSAGASDPAYPRNRLVKIHALSIVEIGDDVEIGALTSIDRGTLKPTRIGSGSKVDDQVLIGHNVEIGPDCMLCGQVGLAGSVEVGAGAVLGGKVGVADHLKIGAGAVVGGGSGVGSNVPAGEVYLGYPAVPRRKALEGVKLLHRIGRFLDAEGRRRNGSAAGGT